MGENLLEVDSRSQIPRLCNLEMLSKRVGTKVRVVGRIISMNGDNLVMQTPDGAKVMCVVGQNAGLKTMQVVEIYAVVLSGANRSEHNLYLQQYGQIYRWDDMTNMGHLDSAIKLMDHPRIAKHIRFPADNCANY